MTDTASDMFSAALGSRRGLSAAIADTARADVARRAARMRASADAALALDTWHEVRSSSRLRFAAGLLDPSLAAVLAREALSAEHGWRACASYWASLTGIAESPAARGYPPGAGDEAALAAHVLCRLAALSSEARLELREARALADEAMRARLLELTAERQRSDPAGTLHRALAHRQREQYRCEWRSVPAELAAHGDNFNQVAGALAPETLAELNGALMFTPVPGAGVQSPWRRGSEASCAYDHADHRRYADALAHELRKAAGVVNVRGALAAGDILPALGALRRAHDEQLRTDLAEHLVCRALPERVAHYHRAALGAGLLSGHPKWVDDWAPNAVAELDTPRMLAQSVSIQLMVEHKSAEQTAAWLERRLDEAALSPLRVWAGVSALCDLIGAGRESRLRELVAAMPNPQHRSVKGRLGVGLSIDAIKHLCEHPRDLDGFCERWARGLQALNGA